MNVKENVCVVTGRPGGVGRALRTRFARGGGHVVLSDLSEEACERMPISVLSVTAVTEATRERRSCWRPSLFRTREALPGVILPAR